MGSARSGNDSLDFCVRVRVAPCSSETAVAVTVDTIATSVLNNTFALPKSASPRRPVFVRHIDPWSSGVRHGERIVDPIGEEHVAGHGGDGARRAF